MPAAALSPRPTVQEHAALHSGYYPGAGPLAGTLALAGLQDLAARRYEALSGGQQRRVQFAQALETTAQPSLGASRLSTPTARLPTWSFEPASCPVA